MTPCLSEFPRSMKFTGRASRSANPSRPRSAWNSVPKERENRSRRKGTPRRPHVREGCGDQRRRRRAAGAEPRPARAHSWRLRDIGRRADPNLHMALASVLGRLRRYGDVGRRRLDPCLLVRGRAPVNAGPGPPAAHLGFAAAGERARPVRRATRARGLGRRVRLALHARPACPCRLAWHRGAGWLCSPQPIQEIRNAKGPRWMMACQIGAGWMTAGLQPNDQQAAGPRRLSEWPLSSEAIGPGNGYSA